MELDRIDALDLHRAAAVAVLGRLGAGAVLVGPTAAVAHRVRWIDPPASVHIAVARDRPVRRRRVSVHRGLPAPHAVVLTSAGPATSPARTAVDLARGIGAGGSPAAEKVALVDTVMRSCGITRRSVLEALMGCAGLHGVPLAREVVARAREGADSPRETALRLKLVDAGLSEPVHGHVVTGVDGVVVARLDLAWPRVRLGIEYDGRVHLDPDQHSRDLARHNRLRALGWTVLQVDARGLAAPDELVAQVATLLSVSLRESA